MPVVVLHQYMTSLKFVGLAVRKIWRTMCVSINAIWWASCLTFYLKTNLRVALKVGNLSSKFWQARLLGSRIIRYVSDGRTDEQTDRDGQTDKSNAYCPFPTSWDIKVVHDGLREWNK